MDLGRLIASHLSNPLARAKAANVKTLPVIGWFCLLGWATALSGYSRGLWPLEGWLRSKVGAHGAASAA
jgi:hypothetical protein